MPFVTVARTIAPIDDNPAPGDQREPFLYVSPADEVLVVWRSGTSGATLRFRVLDEDGDKLGSEFGLTFGAAYATTLLTNGDILVLNGSGTVFRYNQSGQVVDQSVPLGGVIGPPVELANGNILFTRSSGNMLFGQILSPTLDAVGGAFTISDDADQGSLIVPLAGGGFAVAQSLFNVIKEVQAYDASGAKVGPELALPGFTSRNIEALPDGGYVLVGGVAGPPPTFTTHAVIQTFNADGTARIAQMTLEQVHTPGAGISNPNIAALDDQLFVLSYSTGDGGFGQLVHASGRELGAAFELTPGFDSLVIEAIDADTFVTSQISRNVSNDNDVHVTYWQVDRPNILIGTANGESFDGAGATDRIMAGFGGDDIFDVDSAGDIVHEWAGEGNDTVLSTISYALMAGVSVELLGTDNDAGTAAIDLTGNELAQTIFGNAGVNTLAGGGGGDTLVGLGGNDILDGGTGIDTTNGGAGDDFHLVGDAGDVVQEAAGGGTDRVFASVSYTLTAGAEVELLTTDFNPGTAAINLTGNERAQAIYGNDGANTLSGGGGADALIGFGGDDQYVITDGREAIYESGGGGTDRIFAHVDYRLQAGASVEIITTDLHIGTAAIDLIGNELAQLIYGNAGDNQLTGGGGGDTLIGFGGNDFYFVGDASDVVIEAAGGGSDRIFASASHVLAAGSEVEILSTDFNPGTAAINLTGNALAQGIYGNAGANQLNGGGGADSLVGFGGDDWYFIVGGQENVFESAGGGSDRILAGVDYRLQAGAEVELITTDFNAGTAAIDLTGNEFSQAIYGNAGNNILDGGAGKDVLIGNGGADIFLFSTALNTAPGTAFAALAATANVDQIHGFAFDDKIGLDAARFGLTPGALAPGAFVTGTAAQDADDRIIYDPTTGALLFDADGNGAGAAQLFAYISGPFNLDSTFFAVI